MTRRKVLIIGLLAAIPVAAQFGGGLIVYDPTNGIQLINQLANMVQQLSTARSKLQLAVFQAQYLRNRVAWRTPITPWELTQSADTFGLNRGYLSAVNYGANGRSGYSPTVEPLARPDAVNGLR